MSLSDGYDARVQDRYEELSLEPWFSWWRAKGASRAEALRAARVCMGRPRPRVVECLFVTSFEQALRAASQARFGVPAGAQWSQSMIDHARWVDALLQRWSTMLEIPAEDLELVRAQDTFENVWILRQKSDGCVFARLRK